MEKVLFSIDEKCAVMLLFLPYDPSDRTFIVKQKSILKHQKLLLRDVMLGAWILKNSLICKDQ